MNALLRPAAEARDFLARLLANPDLAAEVPLVFDARFGGETIAIEDEGEVRAACTLLVREFHSAGRRMRAGLIGSVATDPAWRRRGLATRLLAEAEGLLRARGAVFALLWANRAEFYLERGYSPFGGEQDVLLVSELVPLLPEPIGVRALRAEDVPFLHRLVAGRPEGVERTLDETHALFEVPGMTTLVLERRGSADQPALPVAFACLGRGHDLTDVVHDWAGPCDAVLALCRAHLERRFPDGESGALFLMAPPSACELVYSLVRLGAVSKPGILGLGKLLDLGGAAELLRGVLGPAATVEVGSEGLTLRGPRAGATLEAETLQALLFGAPPVRADARALLERLGFERPELPLAPFAFGLDSI